jgi:uncharacterized small protein (DUF1192 family)
VGKKSNFLYVLHLDIKDQKIALLEKQLERASSQLMELAKRIGFLERENNRRKQDVNTLSRRN